MSTTTNSISVTVDARIQTQPDLRKAVELGSNYFTDMYLKLPSDMGWSNQTLQWKYLEKGSYATSLKNDKEDIVRVTFIEDELETGRYEVHEDIPVRRMFDDYGRSSHMTRLLLSSNRNKHKVLQAQVSKLLQEMEESGDGV